MASEGGNQPHKRAAEKRHAVRVRKNWKTFPPRAEERIQNMILGLGDHIEGIIYLLLAGLVYLYGEDFADILGFGESTVLTVVRYLGSSIFLFQFMEIYTVKAIDAYARIRDHARRRLRNDK